MAQNSYEYKSSSELTPELCDEVKNWAELNTSSLLVFQKQQQMDHNRDCCVDCNEGGNLICCHQCSASFHPKCCDPTLTMEDIPAGNWLCNACRAYNAAGEENSSAPSTVDTQKKTRIIGILSAKKKAKREDSSAKKVKLEEGRNEEAEGEATNLRAIRVKGKKEQAESPQDAMNVDYIEDINNLGNTPMETLILAAAALNPKEMDLPFEMKTPITCPGSVKDVEGNNVPLPAKKCFVCQGNSRQAALLQCDYCPLLYHQDCLDPPLNSLPTGRWMCPNHIKRIDTELVNSISVAERGAIWDKFSVPIDEQAIKVDFSRPDKPKIPGFCLKESPDFKHVVVPIMVQQSYQNAPPLLPSRREYIRCIDIQKLKVQATVTLDESEEKYNVVSIENDSLQNTREGTSPVDPTNLPSCSMQQAKQELNPILEPQQEHPTDPSTSDHSDSELEQRIEGAVQRRKEFIAANTRQVEPPRENVVLQHNADTDEILAVVEQQLKEVQEEIIKILAWQQAEQRTISELTVDACRRAVGSSDRFERVSSLLGVAAQRANPQRPGVARRSQSAPVLQREDRERISAVVLGERPIVPKRCPPTPIPEVKNGFIIATLVHLRLPLGSDLTPKLDKPTLMRSNCLRIGTQSCCHVVLDKSCCRVSSTHAIIYRDQVTNRFELLNYSEWGTRVNGVLYSNDMTPRPQEAPQKAAAEAEVGDTTMRHLFTRHLRPRPSHEIPIVTMAEGPCTCSLAPPVMDGPWEGSVTVPHGALLQFGCFRFVFSITNLITNPFASQD